MIEEFDNGIEQPGPAGEPARASGELEPMDYAAPRAGFEAEPADSGALDELFAEMLAESPDVESLDLQPAGEVPEAGEIGDVEEPDSLPLEALADAGFAIEFEPAPVEALAPEVAGGIAEEATPESAVAEVSASTETESPTGDEDMQPEPVAVHMDAAAAEVILEEPVEPLEALPEPEPLQVQETLADAAPPAVEFEATLEPQASEPPTPVLPAWVEAAEMEQAADPAPETAGVLEQAAAGFDEGDWPVEEPEEISFEAQAAAGDPALDNLPDAGEADRQTPQPEALSFDALSFDATDEMLKELLDSEEGQQLLRSLEGSAGGGAAGPEPAPEAETSADGAPAQAGLEELIGSIDEGLERAAPISAAAEQPAIVHKQFSQLDDYVVFSLSGGDYALPVRDVAEIGRVPGVTKVPNVPEFVRGITNLRGEIVPVLNLPVLLGLQESAPTARGRVLFLQAREPVAAAGLLVDEVKGIQRIPSQQLEQVGGLVDDKVTSVLRGVHGRGDRLLNILDLEQVFRLEEFQRFERR